MRSHLSQHVDLPTAVNASTEGADGVNFYALHGLCSGDDLISHGGLGEIEDDVSMTVPSGKFSTISTERISASMLPIALARRPRLPGVSGSRTRTRYDISFFLGELSG